MSEQAKIEEYKAIQTQVIMIAKLVTDMPLDEHVAAQRRALEFGPILDPTGWIQNNKALAFDLRMAEALLAFQREVTRAMEDGER